MFSGLKWVQIGIGAVIGFALAWLIHLVILAGVNEKHQHAMDEQKTALEASCLADKKLTEENSREWQKQVADLASKLNAAKRVLPTRCIVPTAGKAGSSNRAPAGDEHARPNGVTTDALLDLASDCERLRIQVISLQDFIDKVWAAKGQ